MLNGLISRLIKYALLLAAAGELLDATTAMRRQAFRATRPGLISLRALNRGLVGPGR
jgi:hypothetical protein